MYCGLSRGGATYQGLEKAMDLADESYVVFDPSGRTFHPKIAVAKGPSKQTLFVGSQNMTQSGLSRNFEVGLSATWNGPEPTQVFIDAEEYIQRIRDTDSMAKALTPDLLKRLMLSSQIVLQDEFASPPADSSVIGPIDLIFSKTSISLSNDTAEPVGSQRSKLTKVRPFADLPIERWSKVLPAADAQRLGGTANPSGHVALTQAGYDIDHLSYFRNILFGECDWVLVTQGGKARERAVVAFDISRVDPSQSVANLEIDHYLSWASSQNNRATTLRWGDPLNSYVRNILDLTGKRLIIEKFSAAQPGGTYRYRLSQEPA